MVFSGTGQTLPRQNRQPCQLIRIADDKDLANSSIGNVEGKNTVRSAVPIAEHSGSAIDLPHLTI